MRILISYPTDIGTFYIGQSLDKKYHALFNEDSLGAYEKVWHAVDALVDNSTSTVLNPETGEVVDTSTLGINQDYTQWDSSY